MTVSRGNSSRVDVYLKTIERYGSGVFFDIETVELQLRFWTAFPHKTSTYSMTTVPSYENFAKSGSNVKL